MEMLLTSTVESDTQQVLVQTECGHTSWPFPLPRSPFSGMFCEVVIVGRADVLHFKAKGRLAAWNEISKVVSGTKLGTWDCWGFAKGVSGVARSWENLAGASARI
jgi:hypothetical protein